MVLVMLFPIQNVLYAYISTFPITCAMSNLAVFYCPFISCFHGMLLRYFLNDFDMVPVAPIFIGVTFAVLLLLLLVYQAVYF